MRGVLLREEFAEDAIDLSDVSGHGQNAVAIVGEARPLRMILPRRVPKERRAHRRVRLPHISQNDMRRAGADIEAGDAVEDHADGVDASGAPGPVFGQARLGDGVVARIPEIDFGAQLGLFLRIVAASENGPGEFRKGRRVRENLARPPYRDRPKARPCRRAPARRRCDRPCPRPRSAAYGRRRSWVPRRHRRRRSRPAAPASDSRGWPDSRSGPVHPQERVGRQPA